MAEYIRKDTLTKVYMMKGKDRLRLSTVINELEMLPAADVAPVRHGRWKGYTRSAYRGTDDFGDPVYRDVLIYYCSNCDRKTIVKERYCPHCGAKMDLEDEV